MTVIATPAHPSFPSATPSSLSSTPSPSPSSSPGLLPLPLPQPQPQRPPASQFNPDAAPFVPRLPHTIEPTSMNSLLTGNSNGQGSPGSPGCSPGYATKPGGKRMTPCFMYWSSTCPEGRLVPLRQPQPPVYFLQDANHGQSCPTSTTFPPSSTAASCETSPTVATAASTAS